MATQPPRRRPRPTPEPPKPAPAAWGRTARIALGRRRSSPAAAGNGTDRRRSAPRQPAPEGSGALVRAVGRGMLAALAGSARTARVLGRQALAAVGSETGRRLGRAAVLTMALAVLVVALYDRGEVPSAAAQPAVRAAADGAPGGSAARRGDAARRQDPDGRGGLRGRPRPPQAGERPGRPADVAAAWYAARHGLPRAKVKPLQQDRLSAREVRVLVLADPGRGRLRTALVRVRLGPAGWSVR
jgi:hypothetical protein